MPEREWQRERESEREREKYKWEKYVYQRRTFEALSNKGTPHA